MPIIEKFRHRPEIDGLRAIAVLAVVLYHGGFSCPGGFVGVDVFFVISGYLITSLIWKDLESGKFTFANFWERRARRILPALIVMTLVTLVAGWFLLLPIPLTKLGQATASQTAFAVNFYYWQNSGYFSPGVEENPLLHTWSLAVEEQFYFVIPVLLWALYRFAKVRSRRSVISVLGSLFVLSFVVSIYSVAKAPDAAFYLLPSRAWELLCGSLLAFLPTAPRLLEGRATREFFAWSGLALILFPILKFSPATPFPGLGALPPCLGATLLIWANSRNEGGPTTAVGKFLSTGPMIFIGAISYSFYLWHWPFLAFSKSISIIPLTYPYRFALLMMGFFCAVLSWKFVETPFRERKWGATRKAIFTFAGAGLAVTLSGALLYMTEQGFPNRFVPEVQKFAEAEAQIGFRYEPSLDEIRSGNLRIVGAKKPNLPPSVLIWGDSHAMAAMPAFSALLQEKGLRGYVITESAMAPVVGWYFPQRLGLNKDALTVNALALGYVKSKKIRDVILCGRWGQYTEADTRNRQSDTSFSASFLSTVKQIKALGARVWIIVDVPGHSFKIPKALASPLYSRATVISMSARPTAKDELEDRDPNLMEELKDAGATLINPKPLFLDAQRKHYQILKDGVVLYRDSDHMTPAGANLMLLPLLQKQLKIP